jgi:hypothetical protein
MASGIYNRFKANLMNKVIDLEADTVMVMLMTTVHAFTATHNVIGDVSANEITGTAYVAGGAELTGKSVTQAATTKWDGTDVTWAASTITAYHAIIYNDLAGSDELICSIDFGGAKSSSEGDFKIAWHADGIITLA